MSRNTIYNWFVKGSKHLNKVLPVLKEKLLAKGAVVNCDETWCRVKEAGKYGKKYIWCMVNKEAKVAVYFYDDGNRGCKVLRDFLGETKIMHKIIGKKSGETVVTLYAANDSVVNSFKVTVL